MNTQTERRSGAERRDYTFSTFRNCAVAPRRMQGRRKSDRRYAILDRFDSGVVSLAVILMILSVLDAVFTLTIISRGGSEANPFMDMLLQHSVWTFTGFKMLLTGIPAIVLVATSNLLLFRRYRARSILAALVGIYLGLMAYHAFLLSVSAQ
ncbi:MAG: DUF5658 family protein [Granulosicoccus sp.]